LGAGSSCCLFYLTSCFILFLFRQWFK
jgi:hypothetical protein